MKENSPEFIEDLKEAVKYLKNGGIILYPTDTVWGLGCDARNSEAVKKIYALKERSEAKSMLVLVNNEAALERLVEDIPEVAWQLLDTAVNPLTIIYDNAKNVAKELIAEDGSLGIRLTKESFSSELCKRLGGPLVSTSANKSGEKSPSCFNEITEDIKQSVDYIVKYRQQEKKQTQPSNIIKLDKNSRIKIIR